MSEIVVVDRDKHRWRSLRRFVDGGVALLLSGSSGEYLSALSCLSLQELFCRAGNACGSCTECMRIKHFAHEDVLQIFPDGRSIKTDQIDACADFLLLAPQGVARVLVLHDAHLLTVAAANSLLKIIEELPPKALFLAVSDHPGRVLSTIRSRCIQWESLRSRDIQTSDEIDLTEQENADLQRIFIDARNPFEASENLDRFCRGADIEEALDKIEKFLNQHYRNLNAHEVSLTAWRRDQLSRLRQFGVKKKIKLNLQLQLEAV